MIEIGFTLDEAKKLNKSFTAQYSYDCKLKENTSVISPVIIIEGSIVQAAQCNYAYIPAFGRYYFITNITSRTSTIYEMSLKSDVLNSFKAEIMSCQAYVARNEDIVSHMISDAKKLKQVNPAITTIPFTKPAAASGYTYCLITTKSSP